MHFKMSSAIYFNLDQSKILLSGHGLKCITTLFQTLARQLAEVLLRGICENSYIPYSSKGSPTNGKGSSVDLTPRKYSSDRWV